MILQRLLERLRWLRPQAKPVNEPPAPAHLAQVAPVPAPTMPRLDRLDLQAAIIHHLEWCVLFNEHLSVDGPRTLQPAALPGTEDSDLGRWLARMAQRQIGQHPHFIELQQEHQRFHALAHRALQYTRQQRMDLASTLLNTEFERSRAQVLDMLRRMQKG